MKKKVNQVLDRKEAQLKEIYRLYDEHNSGSKEHTLSELIKSETEVKAQISVLRHLLTN